MRWDVTIEGRGSQTFPGVGASDALYRLWGMSRDYIGMGSVKVDPYDVNGLKYCRCTFPFKRTYEKIEADTMEGAAAEAMRAVLDAGIAIDPTNWQAHGSK